MCTVLCWDCKLCHDGIQANPQLSQLSRRNWISSHISLWKLQFENQRIGQKLAFVNSTIIVLLTKLLLLCRLFHRIFHQFFTGWWWQLLMQNLHLTKCCTNPTKLEWVLVSDSLITKVSEKWCHLYLNKAYQSYHQRFQEAMSPISL